jgi:hypothetical protein
MFTTNGKLVIVRFRMYASTLATINATQFFFTPGFKSDIEIAQAQTPKRIVDLATEIGLQPDELESYGRFKAKVELNVLDRLAHRKDGKYIVVSGCVLPRICLRSCKTQRNTVTPAAIAAG